MRHRIPQPGLRFRGFANRQLIIIERSYATPPNHHINLIAASTYPGRPEPCTDDHHDTDPEIREADSLVPYSAYQLIRSTAAMGSVIEILCEPCEDDAPCICGGFSGEPKEGARGSGYAP